MWLTVDLRFRHSVVEYGLRGATIAGVGGADNMHTIFRTVIVQIAVTVAAAVVAGLVVGTRGAVSAAMGGAVYVLPNLFFALHLGLLKFRPQASFATAFLLGEFVKLVMAFSLLAGVVMYYNDLHWPSMLIGLALATQVMFLSFGNKG